MVVKVEEVRYINEIYLEEHCKICNAINSFSLPEAKYKDSIYGLVYKCRECNALNETSREEYLQYLEKCRNEELNKQ